MVPLFRGRPLRHVLTEVFRKHLVDQRLVTDASRRSSLRNDSRTLGLGMSECQSFAPYAVRSRRLDSVRR